MPPTKIAPNISISVEGISNGKNNDKLPHRLPSRQQQQQRKRSSPSPPSKRSRSFGSTTSSTSSSSVGTGTNKHKSSAPPPQHPRKTHQPRPTTTATFATATTKEDQHQQQLATIMDISNRGSTFEQTPKGEAQMVQMGRMGSQRLGIGNSTAAALGMGGSGRHFDDVFLDDQPIGRGGTLGTYHYKSNPHDGAGRRRTLCVGLLIFLVLFCAALGFHVAHKDKDNEKGNLKGTTALPTTIEPTMTEEEYEQDMKEQSEALLQDLANEKEAIEGALANVRDEQRDPNNTPEEQEILDEKEDVLEDLENAYKQEEDVENFLTDDRVTDEMADLAEKDEELLENQQGHLQQEIDVLNVELNNADHGNNDVAETEELEEELGEIKAEEASLRDQEEAVEAEVDELIADFMEHTSPPAGDNKGGEQTAAEVNQETEQGAKKEEDGQ